MRYVMDDVTYEEVASQEYAGNDCKISAGTCEGVSHARDTTYLMLERTGPDGEHHNFTIHMRPDELAAVGHVVAGTLWSVLYGQLDAELKATGAADDAG